MSKIYVDEIVPKTTGGTITTQGLEIAPQPGQILQQLEYMEKPTAHVTGTNAAWVTVPYSPAPIITPKSATSKIKVCAWSNMAYSPAQQVYMNLFRKIGSGSFERLTLGSYYWTYFLENSTWQPIQVTFIDEPNTTETVEYQVQVINGGGSNVFYYCHSNMEHGFSITEIAG